MEKRKQRICIGITLVLIIVVYLSANDVIGIRKSKIEQDTRKSAQIDASWQTAKETTENISALLFYSEDGRKFRSSIYVNRPGFSFGYFFRFGGSLPGMEEGIAEISMEGYKERIFISMNQPQIAKVVVEEGGKQETIDVDDKKPFVYIFKKNENPVFYDRNDTIVEPVGRNI